MPDESERELELDPKTHRRLLLLLNTARTPEELAYAPINEVHDEPRETLKRPDVDEPMQMHERRGEKLIDIEQARHILEERDRLSPVNGFAHLDQVRELVGRHRLGRYLELLSMHLDAATFGDWTDGAVIKDPVTGVDIDVVHAAMLRTEWVLFIEAGCGLATSRTPLWNRETGEIKVPPAPAYNLYCSGHSFLSDGKLLVVGGGGESNQFPKNQAWIFDPATETWDCTRDKTTGVAPGPQTYLNYERWYPTGVTLGDEPGRVLVASGNLSTLTCGSPGTTPSPTLVPMPMEIYSESTGKFSKVTTGGDKYFFPTYPGLHLLPGGEIFYAPVGFRSGGSAADDCAWNESSAYFDFDPVNSLAGTWTSLGANDRTKGMSVLLLSPTYPFAQVMTVGGGNLAKSRTYQIINLSTLSPVWGPQVNLPIAPMQPEPTSRVNVNLVLLPDGTVFMSGGAAAGEHSWLYNPATNTWARMDPAPRERRYHSHALLLPTGEVMSCGWTNNTIDIFRPPYLHNGAQPVIDAIPALVHHGQEFAIETAQAPQIAKVVLVRPMAATHNTDSEQRVIQLLFHSAGPTTLSATAPNGWHPHATAPRGWYMLFILNGDGVPSKAKFIELH